MMTLLNTTELNIAHVQTIVRGMHAVALAEGVHDAELVLMKDFYDQCARETDAIASFEDVVETPFDAATAKSLLGSDSLKQTFLASCLFLAYADGAYSAKERSTVQSLAAAIEIGPEHLAEIEELVADQLMAQFAHIDNLEALKEVSGEMRGG